MAFHPLRTFQKNRKFWMASILLVCMATFVLCTGLQGGDFGGWLMGLISGRGGSAYATIDGRSYYHRDFEEIRKRRDIANEFMRKATAQNLHQLGLMMDDAGKIANAGERQGRIHLFTVLAKDLSERLERPRYFEGGTKFDEIVDFILWRNQADRLGVNLGIEGLRELIQLDVHGRPVGFLANLVLDPAKMRHVYREVRWNFHEASDSVIEEALMDEYRVRIAQLALSEVQWFQFRADTNNPARLHFHQGEWGLIVRQPVTPEQFHQYFVKNRAAMEISLVPFRLEELGKKLPDPKSEDLAAFFKRHQEKRFDPTVEEPGFQYPPEVKVEVIWADADMPYYKRAAAAMLAAEVLGPPAGLAGAAIGADPLSTLGEKVSTTVGHAGKMAAWEALLHRQYADQKKILSQRHKYLIPPWTDPSFAMAIVSRKPPQPGEVGALLGGVASADFQLSALAGYQAGPYLRHAKELAPEFDAERKTRGAVGLTMLLAGTMDTQIGAPLLTVALARDADWRVQFRPMTDVLRDELRGFFEKKYYAQPWVNKNMIAARDELEAKKGNRWDVDEIVRNLVKSGRVEHKVSPRASTQYDIDTDPAVALLRKSWVDDYHRINNAEGRGGTPSALKEDHFYKLFFENESFSVGGADPFVPRFWPPALQPRPKANLPPAVQKALEEAERQSQRPVDRFEKADRPFVFWKREFSSARVPKTYNETDDVRRAVERAYRIAEARKTVVPKITKAAESLLAQQKKGENLFNIVRDLSREQGADQMILNQVAPLVPLEPRGALLYGPYELPRGKIPYPREDTANHLLSLNDLKEPIKLGIEELDKLNKKLFDERGENRAVQVLTNRPRTEYYLAVVVTPPTAQETAFQEALKHARGFWDGGDMLFDQFQRQAGEEYRRGLLEQMRQNVKIEEAGNQERQREQKKN